MASLNPFTPSLPRPRPHKLHPKLHPNVHPHLLPLPPPRFYCHVSSSSTTITSSNEKTTSASKAFLRARLAHQVSFGDHVAVVGSAKELGSWKKPVPMEWTEHGWVADISLHVDKPVEFKFVIHSGDGGVVWESGENRVLNLPKGGAFDIACHWDRTDEALEISGEGEVKIERVEGLEGVDEGEASSFVEQWQGGAASFMKSNEHGSKGVERRWDTDGLEGVALRLVEADRTARNWWRKVYYKLHLSIVFYWHNHDTTKEKMWFYIPYNTEV